MPATERLRQFTFGAFEWMTPKGYQLEVMNEENLGVLNEHPQAPVVLLFNHSKYDDIFLAFHLINKYARERLDDLIIPVSEEYVKYSNFARYAFFVDFAKTVGRFKMPEIVQSYRRRSKDGDDVLNNLEIKSSRLDRQFLKFLDKELPGGPVLFISPEGHRSEFLLPAEAGVGHIARKMDWLKRDGKIADGYFIPLAIEFRDNEDSERKYNPVKRPELILRLGEPIDLGNLFSGVEKISKGAKPSTGLTSHYLMARLSEILPPSMQGVYHPSLLQDTLAGRFEQRTRNNGSVAVYDTWAEEFFDISEIQRT